MIAGSMCSKEMLVLVEAEVVEVAEVTEESSGNWDEVED